VPIITIELSETSQKATGAKIAASDSTGFERGAESPSLIFVRDFCRRQIVEAS
jgi:hypothetical protein